MRISTKLALAATMLAGFTAQAQAQQTVTLMAYTGLFQDRYTAAVVEPFMKANPGIKINYVTAPNSAQMLGTLRAQKVAPQVDVAIMDVSVAKAGTDEGIFDALDEKAVPSLAELYPNAKIPGVAGVAVTFDNLVLIYNTDAYPTAPTSLKALADKSAQGKVVIPGIPDIQGISLLAILDKVNGGPGVTGRFEKGIVAMADIAPNVQTWEPKPEVYVPVVNGQATIGVGWNARAQVNTDTSGGKMKAVLPSEGTVFQINVINLVKGGPQNAAAQKFIDYALSKTAQKAFTEAMFYAPTNAKAEIAPSAIDRTAVKFMDKVVPVDWLEVAKVRDALARPVASPRDPAQPLITATAGGAHTMLQVQTATDAGKPAAPPTRPAGEKGFLSLRGLTKRYGTFSAVDKLDLDVAQGELVAFLGPSGCGKTTCLRMLAGLTPATEGSIHVGGRELTDVPTFQRDMGVVFQSYALFPHLTVARNVSFGLEMRKVPRSQMEQRVAEAIAMVRLSGREAHKPTQLSGGQQQRVALARALVVRPSILLLDEPLSNLDAKLRDEMRTEIRDIQQKMGITAIFVTHDQGEALTMCDKVAVMNQGRLEQLGTPEDLYERPATPFVAGFVGRSSRLSGDARGTEIQTAGGCGACTARDAGPGDGHGAPAPDRHRARRRRRSGRLRP